MRLFGLIGYPLTHSFSSAYFAEKFNAEKIPDAVYKNFALSDIASFPDLLKQNPELCGLNVTIPYKKTIIPFLHILDATAKTIGAVNTIKVTATGEEVILEGYNTDHLGFRMAVEPLISSFRGKALILGTGGSSEAVAFALKQLDIPFLFVTRGATGRGRISYSRLDETMIRSHRLIINTTPLGMFPHTDSLPDIPYHAITADHLLFDLVYNPPETGFLRKGKEKGAVTMNGQAMLRFQAEESWKIWNRV